MSITPTITAITDSTLNLTNEVVPGDLIVVTGTNFGPGNTGGSIGAYDYATGSIAISLHALSWSDTQITFFMPKTTPTEYVLIVETDNSGSSQSLNTLHFNVLPVWNGTYFDDVTWQPSMFVRDFAGNAYLFEQNYRGFFPVNVVNGAPIYAGTGARISLPSNTPLRIATDLAAYTTQIGISVVQQRYDGFRSDPSNILNSITQRPSTLVQDAISSAIASNQNLQAAVNQAAGYLTDPSLNFILSDILNGWNGGALMIQQLSKLVNNHASTIHQIENRVKHLADFKSKLLHQVTDEADRLRALQNEIDQTLVQSTFTTLVSAFPDIFGPIEKSLQNQHTFLAQEILRLLPGASAVYSNAVNSLVNQILGGFLPAILNPADKLLNDLQNLVNDAETILNEIPIEGFANLADETALVDQVANLLNYFISKIILTARGSIPQPIIELSRILTDIDVWAQQQVGINTDPLKSAENQAIIAAAEQNGINQYFNQGVTDPTDPAGGGTFANISNIAAVAGNTPSTTDPPQPDDSLSPDVTIAATQNARNVAQTQADNAGARRIVARGDCINNIADVPLKPRSVLLDGSLGDFSGSKKIPF